MHHTVAYTASIAQNVEVDVAALADSVLLIQNGHFVPPQDMPVWYEATCSVNIARTRLSAPKFGGITTPFIRPVSNALNFGMPQRVNALYADQLILNKLEEVSALSFQTGAAAERVFVVLGLGVRRTPAPGGDVYTLRGTSTTAVTANTWTQVTMTWQNFLPVGTYSVIGMTHQSATSVAARIISPPEIWRPGCLGITALGNEPDQMFRNGGLGEWIRFQNYQFPLIEVLASAADAAHEVYLDLVKVS